MLFSLVSLTDYSIVIYAEVLVLEQFNWNAYYALNGGKFISNSSVDLPNVVFS